MAIHPSEEATLRAFLVSTKREREVAAFGHSKKRQKSLNRLNHNWHWDGRFAYPMLDKDILALLREAGAPPICHVISNDDELDGRDMPLADAVAACENYPFASVLCCIPGELAFFWAEANVHRPRMLLYRPREHRQS